ncbi:MAG: ribosome small subunit-dependent GTPase A [Clostridiales bacterium]|nr:ribosome small subunit-dependent GTPase A [Clostridiales bacterium]
MNLTNKTNTTNTVNEPTAATAATLRAYGYTGSEPQNPADNAALGRITEQHRDRCTAVTCRGEVVCSLKGKFYLNAESRQDFPCVGDFVRIKLNENGNSQIESLLPRRTKFSHADFSGHAAGYAKTIVEQVVAANFDYVFILSSLNADFKVSRLERYLTQARQSLAQPVVILTKADLAEDVNPYINAVINAAPDTSVHAVSSRTGFGIDSLKKYLMPGKTVVFLGMSGVGKSSLVNALMGDEVMDVKGIRESDGRGRHTTTHRQLFMLPGGAMIIDTPGMRELGLFNAGAGLSAGFADIEELFKNCRFSDCNHTREPGCAVLAALENGTLEHGRWEKYVAETRENKFVNDKAGFLDEKKARNKSISMHNRKMKKKGVIRK